MRRSILPRFLAFAAIPALIASSGCKAPTVQYQIMPTATLRVMNFAPNCTSPMDVYWGPASEPISNKAAIIRDLKYGAASVYTNSIVVAATGTPYLVVVRPTNDTTKQDIQVPITLMPSGKYTIVVTRDPNNPANFISTVLTDDVVPSGYDPSHYTFVRFMNLQSGVGPLSLHVNDPACGDAVTPNGEQFGGFTSYVPLKTAQDTSFAFFVTDSTNQIIARLTYQTFVAGSYYTLIYGGDLCNTPLDNPADTVNDADDSLRLRVFDDNDNGADQTNPPPSTYRYNIINALTPEPGVSLASVGYTVYGADFPEYNNFSIPAIPVDAVGGAGVGPSAIDNGILNVNYQSAVIPVAPATAVSVVAEGLDNNGASLGQLFTSSMTESGTLDTAIAPNHSVSFIFFDTIGANLKGNEGTKELAFSVPDQSYPDSVTFIFVPGAYGPKTADIYTSFYYAVNGGSPTTTRWNSSSGTYAGNLGRTGKPTYRVSLAAGTSEQITITDTLAGTTGTGKIPFPTKTFTAEAGGIYEIVTVGSFSQPATLNNLIVRVNAPPGH